MKGIRGVAEYVQLSAMTANVGDMAIMWGVDAELGADIASERTSAVACRQGDPVKRRTKRPFLLLIDETSR